jgi:hypothetical protein
MASARHPAFASSLPGLALSSCQVLGRYVVSPWCSPWSLSSDCFSVARISHLEFPEFCASSDDGAGSVFSCFMLIKLLVQTPSSSALFLQGETRRRLDSVPAFTELLRLLLFCIWVCCNLIACHGAAPVCSAVFFGAVAGGGVVRVVFFCLPKEAQWWGDMGSLARRLPTWCCWGLQCLV